MNKFSIILSLLVSIPFMQEETLAPDISFIDLPFNAKSSSLGNTYLSNVGSPINILLKLLIVRNFDNNL